ncbi:solute carrier family 23 protein [Maridesulfovibrio sp.]|uniref:uracil-xanthine permease family protein n=1 Tax=Maridesulfovibrio sp. TaxID=2795000 RepID=UPI002A18AAA5|nr:solute carrier family 23 protein [Maridesulfovibrio sp.]
MQNTAGLNNQTNQPNGFYYHLITAVLSLQHVIILFIGIAITPAMLAEIYNLPPPETHHLIFMTTVGAGLATLIQPYRAAGLGLGMPMFMGTSGAFMSCAHAAISLGGFPFFCSLALLASPFQIIFSYGIRFLRQILTPTVGGVIIMLAMVGLLKDSLITWVGQGPPDGQSGLLNILVGMITISVMILVEWLGRDRLRPWSLFLGLSAGILAEILIGDIDFSQVGTAAWLGLPPMKWPEFSFDISNPGHWATYFTFIISVQVTSIKYVGDAMALQKVMHPGQKRTDFNAIQGGLYSNSISMILTSFFGGMPPSSHSPNIPLMEMTGIASRRVAVLSALILIVLICSPKTAYLLDAIPGEVMGAVGVVLVAHLFSTGVRMIAAELDHKNGVIAGLSLCFGLIAENDMFYPEAFPEFIRPISTNGFAVGGLVAVLLTILTRLSIKHFLIFFLEPSPDQLVKIRDKVSTFTSGAGMSLRNSNYLELACEEIFVHALGEFERENIKGLIRFKMYRQNKQIQVEISFGSRLDTDLDHNCNANMNACEMKEEELQNLGLMLLSKIIKKITHQNMGKYTYLCFSLPLN